MKQRTLLIVDDEPMILKAVLRILRNDNYTIFTAESAEEGLKNLEGREMDLKRECDTLKACVHSRDALLYQLEKEHPGITKVEKDKDGYLLFD